MAEMPTSGDQKKGDSLFFHTPPPRISTDYPPPQQFDLYRKRSSKKENWFQVQTVNLLTIELQLRVEGSNNLLPLF